MRINPVSNADYNMLKEIGVKEPYQLNITLPVGEFTVPFGGRDIRLRRVEEGRLLAVNPKSGSNMSVKWSLLNRKVIDKILSTKK